MERVSCQTVFLDAGGVIVLPNRQLVVSALARVGIEVGASTVAPAHYEAVRELDRAHSAAAGDGYLATFCRALGVPQARVPHAMDSITDLGNRSRSGEILWSEAAPHAQVMIRALRRAGIEVFIVTNSDGHAAQNLRDAQICHQEGDSSERVRTVVDGVIDSGVVGYAKPHPAIFRQALERAQANPGAVVHVGDTVSADVTGATAAGIVPIHLDPARRCRVSGHRHVRSLVGLWRHITVATAEGLTQ